MTSVFIPTFSSTMKFVPGVSEEMRILCKHAIKGGPWPDGLDQALASVLEISPTRFIGTGLSGP